MMRWFFFYTPVLQFKNLNLEAHSFNCTFLTTHATRELSVKVLSHPVHCRLEGSVKATRLVLGSRYVPKRSPADEGSKSVKKNKKYIYLVFRKGKYQKAGLKAISVYCTCLRVSVSVCDGR